MENNSFLEQAKRQVKAFWNWLAPYLVRFWQNFRRWWRKFHLTKVSLLAVLTIALGFGIYLNYLSRTANVETLEAGLEEKTQIIDVSGQEAGSLNSQQGSQVEIEEISDNLVQAVIATEDKRFYRHRGFDLIGIGRASLGYLTTGRVVGGGSTITQQLAKNAYLSADQTIIRKLRELFLAIEIEKNYSKDQILTMYLNNVYLGHGVWGVEDGSQKYFGKPASDLTVAEAATLVGMLKGPSAYNPIDNYDRAIDRRNTVLQLMVNNDYLTEDQYDEISQYGLNLVDNYDPIDDYRYPYYFDAVISEAIYKYGMDEEELMNRGYTIYTSLNQATQQELDASYRNDSLFASAQDGTPAQAASVALDPQTGGVMAVVGGRGDYTLRGFNRATQMRRQPGSVIKPLGVYAPALENGYHPDSLLQDELTSYGETDYTPTNLSGTYQGQVPLHYALSQSLNAPTVWLLNEIGIDKGMAKLKEFGWQVDDQDRHLGSIALGGMSHGISPLNLASAYSTFANDGVRIEPHFITQIVDATGNVLVDNSQSKPHRVLNQQVNDEMNQLLLDVFDTGTAAVNEPDGYQVAGKTGTTQRENGPGATDQWIVGYTPDLVLASWMGFDESSETHYLSNYANQGVGVAFKYQMEHILPYTNQTDFNVDKINEEDQEDDGGGFLDFLQSPEFKEKVDSAIKSTKEGLAEGYDQFKRGAKEVGKDLVEWLREFGQ